MPETNAERTQRLATIRAEMEANVRRASQRARRERLVTKYTPLIIDFAKVAVNDEYIKPPNNTNDDGEWDVMFEECFNSCVGLYFTETNAPVIDRITAPEILMMINYRHDIEMEQFGEILHADEYYTLDSVVNTTIYFIAKYECYEEWKTAVIQAYEIKMNETDE